MLWVSQYQKGKTSLDLNKAELEDFVGAKFYSPYALADGKQRILISEKTQEFASISRIVYTVSIPNTIHADLSLIHT